MKAFFLCFVPLFVAVDAVGVLPMFMSLTSGMGPQQLRRILFQSVLTAAFVALAFLLGGPAILRLLGITVADFMVAGGVLLFVISMTDLITTEKTRRRVEPETLGAVPIGVPLITGPAVLTTLLLLANEHGFSATAGALLINILLAGLIFWASDGILRVLGRSGTKTVSKIASLLLAAIAVMMVRKGIAAFIASG